ncbi:MAG TPA: sigma-70 family RNA polymerase sigma factor [Bacteroidetes bacterium]|nr:sigma-70 family RNA polymerase sigma factor [Bacteroidota bacterium]
MDEIADKIYSNQDIINRICFAFFSERADREDLFQEIVYRVLKFYRGFNEKSSFTTWLYRIALNTAITYKTKKRPDFPEDKSQAKIEDNSESNDLDEDIRILYKEIGQLAKLEKAIILLYLDEYSYREIAEITGLSPKNVSVKIYRIKKKLHELYIKLTV